MTYYRVVFNDGKPDYVFSTPSCLSRYVKDGYFRSDVDNIIVWQVG